MVNIVLCVIQFKSLSFGKVEELNICVASHKLSRYVSPSLCVGSSYGADVNPSVKRVAAFLQYRVV